MDYNPKPREVWCPRCKQYTIRDDPNPKCKGISCGLLADPPTLFTVTYNLLTGTRVTGNELAKRNN